MKYSRPSSGRSERQVNMKVELAEQRLKQIQAKKKSAITYRKHLGHIEGGLVCPPLCDLRCGACDVMGKVIETSVIKARKAGRSRNLQLR